jgi:iron complex transport system substrate-binding protein
MKKKFTLIFGIMMAFSVTGISVAATSLGFPMRLTDQAGHVVIIKTKPVHIASTTEGTDEILAALVPKKEIAMVTTFSSNPNYSNIVHEVKGIPAIGNANAEQVLAVNPDLVLMASYDTTGVVGQIEQAGVPVYEFTNFNSFANIEHNILVVGKLTGTTAKAHALVRHMQQQLTVFVKRAKGHPHPTVLDDSSYGFAAGRQTTVNDVIVDAGGVNVARGMNGWQKITDEEIVKMNPSVIIDATDDAAFLQQLAKNPALQTVSAIKHHRLYAINSADLSSVSQYAVNGVRDLEAVLYPKHK